MLTKIKTKIDSLGSVYIGSMPDSPDNAICIYPTGGFPADLAGEMLREPTFMIKVRNTSYATGYALAASVRTALHGINGETNFVLIEAQGDIMGIGRDESNREEWTINFRCYYR